jgi:Leucine-rich repeat (LRR) protein
MEYKINKFLFLKLEGKTTYIYMGGKRFDQCKKIILNIPIESVNNYSNIESIDDAVSMHEATQMKGGVNELEYLSLTPEQEFWGHCSNLQGWAEHDYDTRLLHSNLSFPLLRELFKLNDSTAKKVFKEEIVERLSSGHLPVIKFLILNHYLEYFTAEEINVLLEDILRIFSFKEDLAFLFLIHEELATLRLLCDDKPIFNIIREGMHDYIKENRDLRRVFLVLRYLKEASERRRYLDKAIQLIKEGIDLKTIRLITKGLLDNHNIQNINELFEELNFEHITNQFLVIAPHFFKKLIELGVNRAEDFYKSIEFIEKYVVKDEIPFYLDLYSWAKTKTSCLPQIDVYEKASFPLSIAVVDRHIVDINFNGVGLEIIPKSINNLIYLKGLDLSENFLCELPASMSHLKVLKKLNLKHNRFSEFPSFIFQLNELEELSLQINLIKDIPDSFSNLRNLQSLDLSRNLLEKLPDSVTELKNLKILDLNFNTLRVLPDNFGELTSLEILRCDYNNLETLPESIGNLKDLKHLLVDGNNITTLPESILSLNSLEILSFNPEYLEKNLMKILDYLLEKKVFISKPPYNIGFSLFADESYFSGSDQNAEATYGRYIRPERLPLSIDIIDKLNKLYVKHYYLGKKDRTPEYIAKVFDIFEVIKHQLGPNFNVDNIYKRDLEFYDKMHN